MEDDAFRMCVGFVLSDFLPFFFSQVILSSMIKECEIKIENRSIGDAQG